MHSYGAAQLALMAQLQLGAAYHVSGAVAGFSNRCYHALTPAY
eukprot:COSAG02_NODE_16939_length_1042_cov_1.036055_2_plen_42_part_01